MMFLLDRMVAAASPSSSAITIEDAEVLRWVVATLPVRLKPRLTHDPEGARVVLDAWREAGNPRLSRFEPAARARVRDGGPPFVASLLHPLRQPRDGGDPYASGALFHGPALHRLRSLRIGANGCSAVLDASPGLVPAGVVNPCLLDAATHAIPHDELSLFSDRIPTDVVAYPRRITVGHFAVPPPISGEVACEIRFDGFDGDDERYPAFWIELSAGGKLWARLRLVETLFPKGPIGAAPRADRVRFLRERSHVPGLGVATVHGDETRLDRGDLQASDWFPGTLATLYAARSERLAEEVAVKEHLARRLGVHPSRIVAEPSGAPGKWRVCREGQADASRVLVDAGDVIVVRDDRSAPAV